MRRTVRILQPGDLVPDALRVAVRRYGVVCVREAGLDDRAFVRLMAGMGEVLVTGRSEAGFSSLSAMTGAGPGATPRYAALRFTGRQALRSLFLDMRDTQPRPSRRSTGLRASHGGLAHALLDAVYSFAARQPRIRHDWQKGDVVLWDTRTALLEGDVDVFPVRRAERPVPEAA